MRHGRGRPLRAAHASQSGMVLIQVIAFSIILAMITFALVSLTISEYATVTAADKGMRALYIADAAVERAITVLRADKDWNDNASDTTGAEKNMNFNQTTWLPKQPLYDKFQAGGAGNVENVAYPAGGGLNSGTYSIYLKQATDPGDNRSDDIWIRALGTAAGATRAIEIKLHRLTPLDFSVYSAQSFQVSQGGGNVTMHGSAYFFQDLGLKAVQTGLYNDRPIHAGDTAPYLNQIYVKGTLDMSTGNSSVGTAAQPMYGVHAGSINLKNNGTQNLYTQEMDHVVPSIPYPNVAGYISSTLTNQTYANLLMPGQLTMALCVNNGAVWSTQTPSNITFGPSSKFTIPASTYTTCGDGQETNSANYAALWDSSQAVPLTLNSTFKNKPIVVPGTITMSQTVKYSGVATFIANAGGATGLSVSGQILASTPASGSTCGYATPSSMPSSDVLAFIVAGNVSMAGSGNTCNQENDVVIIASYNGTSTFSSTFKVQIYGVIITEQLTTSQNPDFYQMPDMLTYLPSPVTQLATNGVTMPVVVKQWHELSN
ncbi:MAG: hypothetical protein E6H00_07535 [Bacillati bacterium ANGP1]|uniref:Type 4 fimbrial biogenesis protein PilX N-terminal domain-containing protein n=1 Tax=Candidatus Segetimicrobium genomatis TaxID=2569760 RepID=A0A537K399_9BACT|nr:MAG: hypothetical protein E6H00_07535 [Terrabacteria group bacterium ANGP1]